MLCVGEEEREKRKREEEERRGRENREEEERRGRGKKGKEVAKGKRKMSDRGREMDAGFYLFLSATRPGPPSDVIEKSSALIRMSRQETHHRLRLVASPSETGTGLAAR